MAKVLIVDDDTASRRLLVRRLTRLGHEVFEAGDGEAGVASARAASPDVALVDIEMPVMNGHEAVRRIRADPALAGTGLIAMTGHDSPDMRRRLIEEGFDEALTKPVAFAEVVEAIERRLGGGRE